MIIIGSEFSSQGYQLIWKIKEFIQGKGSIREERGLQYLHLPCSAHKNIVTAPGVCQSLTLGTKWTERLQEGAIKKRAF